MTLTPSGRPCDNSGTAIQHSTAPWTGSGAALGRADCVLCSSCPYSYHPTCTKILRILEIKSGGKINFSRTWS